MKQSIYNIYNLKKYFLHNKDYKKSLECLLRYELV